MEPTMTAVIIYDDFACALKARAMLKQAGHRADAAVLWRVKPWRLDELMRPLTADAALEEAADAHLIVLALRHLQHIPARVQDWLEHWAAHRQFQNVALAAWDGGNGDGLSATAPGELSQFAQRHGLRFLFGDTVPAEDGLAV